MLTDNQLGNHRENRAVLGRGGWRVAASLPRMKSAAILPRLIQALVTVSLQKNSKENDANSSKLLRFFCLFVFNSLSLG